MVALNHLRTSLIIRSAKLAILYIQADNLTRLVVNATYDCAGTLLGLWV